MYDKDMEMQQFFKGNSMLQSEQDIMTNAQHPGSIKDFHTRQEKIANKKEPQAES